MRRAALLALSLSLSLPACDDGGGGMDAGAGDAGSPRDAAEDSGRCTEFTPEYCPREYPMGPIPASDICDAFVDAFCRANGLCCSDDSRVYSSFDACVTDQMTRCEDPVMGFEFADRIASMLVLYSQAAAGARYASLATMGDMCVPIRYGDAILDVYTGQVARGAECTHSVECENHGVCLQAGGRGTCIGAPSRLDACSTNDDCVASELRCNESNECDFRLAIDEPCGEDRDCETLYCRSGFCFEATPDSTYCVDLGSPGPAFE
ncbi:MAG: hypothetical protein H6719_03390 [Sandaracinaceae bacterium]|nr:hypothetical protein [Sandaracinaceae bacterium]